MYDMTHFYQASSFEVTEFILILFTVSKNDYFFHARQRKQKDVSSQDSDQRRDFDTTMRPCSLKGQNVIVHFSKQDQI
jgi:hypothetical protein